MSENDVFENSPEERGDEMIVQSGNPLKKWIFLGGVLLDKVMLL